jgi:uncharacterized protein YegP (UPF0339 family)
VYYFHVGVTEGGDPSWALYGNDHKIAAWAGETFASLADARRAGESFKACASTARYEVYLDESNRWRWRAWSSGDQVAAAGGHFDSKSNAEGAAENVRVGAGRAMTGKPIDVDDIRRIFNVSPEDVTDADLRRALTIVMSDDNAEGMPEDVAESVRRFAAAIDRATFG